jgi:hypothetical protein
LNSLNVFSALSVHASEARVHAASANSKPPATSPARGIRATGQIPKARRTRIAHHTAIARRPRLCNPKVACSNAIQKTAAAAARVTRAPEERRRDNRRGLKNQASLRADEVPVGSGFRDGS